MITVYGVPGWGSTISELMLSLADIPYEVVDVEGFDQPGPARERLRQMIQVQRGAVVQVLPKGTVK